MQVADLCRAMEEIAPTADAESWDNVGLLVGDPSQSIARALLTIDYTHAVASEAGEFGCDAVIAYHPPIFSPLKRIASDSVVFDAIRRGVAIYSPHTALDVATGGTNDVLCEVLGLLDCRPLSPAPSKPTHLKLVTFVPHNSLDRVADAMFAAGAGQIGHYASCSFRTEGTGTFFGDATTNPTVGRGGTLERVPETKLEVLVPLERQAQVIDALRATHPYEEPACDLLALAVPPAKRGQGRVGSLPVATERAVLFEKIKRELGIEHLLVAGPTTGSIDRAAVCAGSCGQLLDRALESGAGLYLTGEMRHHDALRAAAGGLTVVCTLHSNSERLTLKRLKQRLQERLPGVEFLLSQKDRDPFAVR